MPVVNVIAQGRNELFTLNIPNDDNRVEVIQVDPKDKHLLLMIKEANPRDPRSARTNKILCGHDEVHWFAAPVGPSARGVADAKISLKPIEVQELEKAQGVRTKNRGKRKNKASIRQGEWFFIPAPDWKPQRDAIVYKNEPLQRDRGSKPHMVQELVRGRSETVWTHRVHAPNGLTTSEHNALSKSQRDEPGWRRMSRTTTAFVRGTVRHPDHKTINLQGWHRVRLNTESASRTVAFLD